MHAPPPPPPPPPPSAAEAAVAADSGPGAIGGAGRPSLLGLDAAALARAVAAAGEPEARAAWRARQVLRWVMKRGARDFSAMTDLPAPLRERLAGRHSLDRPAVAAAQLSADGTRKWLLRLGDGREVEAVFIPEADRGSLCVSTQVGCSLACSFCHTGTMPIVRNLTAGEILGQILVAKDELGDWDGPAGSPRRLTNVIVMGMGEPLLNYANLRAALRLAVDPEGLDLSRRRVTVSTSGVVPRIGPLGLELGTGLAVSLHAVRDDLRDRLVPLNRKWNIAALLEACRAYPGRRPITFEYVLLNGVNDSDADARELVRLLEGLPAKVNLIPFNAWPGAAFEASSNNRTRAFAATVEAGGHPAPVRAPRGRDILAACGQLKTASESRRGRAAAPAAPAPAPALEAA